MILRYFVLGAFAALTGMTIASDVSPVRHSPVQFNVAGSVKLRAYGNRSAQQTASSTAKKLDAALSQISRHLDQVRADHAVADLHTLNPAARFAQQPGGEPMVLIDAVTLGDTAALKSALVALGLQHAASFSNDVGGWLPVSQLSAATLRDEVHAIRAAMPRTRVGAVTTQGDYVQHSDTVRSANSLDGSGITVGIMSDSYDCYAVYAQAGSGVPASGDTGYAYNGFTATAATDISTGDLPSSVNVVEEAEAGNGGCLNYGAPLQLPFTDEGRAMMQIVHDVAPGAALAFYTAVNSEADFANGIVTLGTPVSKGGSIGAQVIADDVGYPDEPFFQDGILAQAIDQVEAYGVAYFSAAGNDGTNGYDNLAPSFSTPGSGVTAGEKLLNWDTSGATTTTTLPVTIPSMAPGEFVSIVLEWDQPFVTGAPNSGGATSQLNLCAENVTGNDIITDDDLNTLSTDCTGVNTLGQDPLQVLIVANPADSGGNSEQATLNVVVGLASVAAPGRIKLAVEDDGLGSTINSFATNSGTLQGHPGAAGAMAVGAAFYFDTPACGTSPATLEPYSSEGGTPILFDSTGTRLATPVTRQKPEIVGPDGGNTTFFGFTLASGGYTGSNGQLNTTNASCQNNASYPNYFGTSAATPHVAGIAALFLQANAALTPAQIYTALEDGAVSMNGSTSPDYLTGYGFVQADASAALIPSVVPVAPTLTLSSSAITTGSSATLTWSSANTTGCTASGSWSGALASSGSQTVTPAAAGSDTYSLTCANAAGSSPTSSVTLTVTAPVATSSSHGGGAIGVPMLIGLAALSLRRRRSLQPTSMRG
jgi:hypothetical protein